MAFEATSPAVKLVEEAQLFMRRHAPFLGGSSGVDFDCVRAFNTDAWLVNFEAPPGVVFFGVFLDSTSSATTAGFAQLHAREMDAMCSPVCSSSNYAQRCEYPLSYNTRIGTNERDDTKAA